MGDGGADGGSLGRGDGGAWPSTPPFNKLIASSMLVAGPAKLHTAEGSINMQKLSHAGMPAYSRKSTHTCI